MNCFPLMKYDEETRKLEQKFMNGTFNNEIFNSVIQNCYWNSIQAI